MTELLEQKSILAKLMASENISVRHAKVPTAGFNPKTRTLILPILKEMEGDVYDLFVCHEVGHALNTPAEGWHSVIEKRGPNYKGFLNVVEDARIEKLIKKKFAGAGKAMAKGYKILVHERDFFGLKKDNIDINSSSLIDKLNIHFKGGPLENVQFSEEERPFIKKMEDLETWEDVEKLTEELWNWAEDNEEDQMSCTDDMSDSEYYEEDEDDEDSDDWDFDERMRRQRETDEENECNAPVDNCDNEEESKGENKEDEEGQSENQTAPQDSVDKKEEEGDEDGNTQSSGTQGGYDQWYEDDPWKWQREPKSETDKNFRVNEIELISEDAMDLVYYNAPTIDLKSKELIINYKTLLKRTQEAMDTRRDYLIANHRNDGEELWDREYELSIGYARQYLKYVDSENKPVVNYLVKEFEMKKKAAEYKRSMTANSGVIALSDIHKYKYCDNIFKKITVVPEGKNHGLYFLMDWSGSMNDKIMPTLIQLYQLIDFCRKCNISHEAYAFTDYAHDNEGNEVKEEEFGKPYKPIIDSLAIGDPRTQLVEIFSNKMTAKEYKAQREYLLMSLLRCDRDYQSATWVDEKKQRAKWKREVEGKNVKDPVETIPYKIFSTWGYENKVQTSWEWHSIGRNIRWPLQRLCGTPLNDAIMISTANVKRFQRENNLDIVNTIILTDGESNSSHNVWTDYDTNHGMFNKRINTYVDENRIKIKLVDPETKKVFEWTDSHGSQQTENFLNYYKFKTGSNILGFFLTSAAGEAGRKVGWSEWEREGKSQYNREGFVIVEDRGYDELYIIKSHATVAMEEGIKIDTSKTNSTASIARAFKKFQKGKLDKRIMLQRFAEKVA